MKRRVNGFSLIEMALVLVIVGLLIGGMLTPLSMQMDQRKIGETQKSLDDAREALLGFALRNGYLPCPAISASNGLEDRNGSQCRDGKRLGFLPWATLGLPRLDSWNHLWRYSVTPAFADSAALFTLNTRRDISIISRDAAGNPVAATEAADIPAVILSHGKNGAGAISAQGVPVADPSASNLDEQFNARGDGLNFVSRDATANPAVPGGEFDDMLVWLSPNILYNRMVAAQKLP